MRRRCVSVLAAALVVASAAPGAALGRADFLTYAGPKTWLQGWYETGPWDSDSTRWYYNEMGNKSCECLARIAFVDSGGSWHGSWQDTRSTTQNWLAEPPDFTKKPLCKNNSESVYTAYCAADGSVIVR